MKPFIKSIIILIMCTFLSCKNNNTLSEYKYSDQETLLNCDSPDAKLWNEALYSFENDIRIFYANNYYSKDGELYLFYSDFSKVSKIRYNISCENYIYHKFFILLFYTLG